MEDYEVATDLIKEAVKELIKGWKGCGCAWCIARSRAIEDVGNAIIEEIEDKNERRCEGIIEAL